MKANWLDDSGAMTAEISTDVLAAEDVHYRKLPTDPAQYQSTLDELREHNGYIEQDQIELLPDNPKLGEICSKFVDEHSHDEDEVRFVLAGGGVFDIRTKDDRWMRVEVAAGDLIVVPKDRFHRFFLTDDNMIRCVRLFRDSAGWVPHYRGAA